MKKNIPETQNQAQNCQKLPDNNQSPKKNPKQPLILAVETSGRIGSVALATGEKLLAESVFSAPLKHSAEIFGSIRDLLEKFDRKPEQIEHIYISIGPGSFTGLRIAATIAKTMHLATGARIIAVDTLDCIAANATDFIAAEGTEIQTIATILDAKRSRFFVAAYENKQGRWQKILPDCLMTTAEFTERFAGGDKPIWLLGEGLVYYKDSFAADGVHFIDENFWNPRASKVHLLGWQMACANRFADALTLQPTYIQRPDVKLKPDMS